MTVVSLFIMDKDRGYAWVILGASTILMCIGPSTYSSFGFLMYDVPIKQENQVWILNIFYGFWLLSAFLASLFAKQSPRQLASTGSIVAAVGFLVSASTVADPSWLYLTFSLLIGFGLGLSFHTAYLVVMSNFDKFKGLANGICQVSIAIGQITTPFLFTIVNFPRDRFQIKALTTAVGFLTTLFFVVPTHTVQSRRGTYIGDRNRRLSTSSRRNSYPGFETVPLQGGFSQVPSNNISISQGQMRPRRRSQYLLAVSTSLLPNIPEEPESTPSINDALTSASSDSEIQNAGQTMASRSGTGPESTTENTNEEQNEFESSTKQNYEHEVNKENIKNEIASVANNLSPRRLSEGCIPSYVSTFTEYNRSYENGIKSPYKIASTQSNTENSTTRRYSESQLQSKTILNPSKLDRSINDVSKSQNLRSSRKQSNSKKTSKKGESVIDLSLLHDFHFCNMAAFSALCTVTVVNFPIVLYAYILATCEECTGEAYIALLIIYIVDLISRLVLSYLSDFPILRRRTSFLVGCGCAGILIAATPLVEDLLFIYCICVMYGICLGMIVTSEYLMFIESFGYHRFPQAYGFLSLFKLLVITALGFFVGNPLAIYFYPIHPLDQQSDLRNASTYCDPLEIHAKASTTRLLLNVAVPSILCAIAWITEDIYKASHKCSTQTKASSTAATSDIP